MANTKKDSEKGTGEITYIVKYRLPGEEGRNVRKIKVFARNQSDAKKAALATIPNAKIIGGPQELDEGLGNFASRVGKFLSRCVGRGCHAYAETPVNANKGTLSIIRKRLTRELAQGVGNKFMRMGGGDESHAKVVIKPKKTTKVRKPTKRRRK
jgi:hypothetical protein